MVSTYTLAMAGLAVGVIVAALLVIVPPRSVRLGLRSVHRRTGTSPRAVLAAAAFGLVVLVFAIAGTGGTNGEFGVVDGLLSLGGAVGPLCVAVGLAGRRMHARLGAGTQCPTGNPDTGVVAVDGSLRPVDGTFAVPDGDGGVLGCTYALQKDRGFASSSPAWATIAEGKRTRPLAVDDGSGELRLDEDNVAFRAAGLASPSYSVGIPEDEPVPEAVDSFLSAVGVESPDRPDVDHRLRIRPLDPGNTVTAVGEYDRVTKPGGAFWGISEGEGPAYLFPGALDGVRSRLARRGTWLTGIGAVMTVVGVGYVAAPFVL